MDHNEFDFVDDLIQPFYNFLEQLGITVAPEKDDPHFGSLRFDEKLYLPPKN